MKFLCLHGAIGNVDVSIMSIGLGKSAGGREEKEKGREKLMANLLIEHQYSTLYVFQDSRNIIYTIVYHENLN